MLAEHPPKEDPLRKHPCEGQKGQHLFLGYTTSCQLVDADGYHAPPMSPRCSKSRIDVKPSARAAFARTIPVAPEFSSSERRKTGADDGDGFDGLIETVRFRSVLHLFIEEGRSIEIAGLKYANYMTALGANSLSIVSLIETQIYLSICNCYQSKTIVTLPRPFRMDIRPMHQAIKLGR